MASKPASDLSRPRRCHVEPFDFAQDKRRETSSYFMGLRIAVWPAKATKIYHVNLTAKLVEVAGFFASLRMTGNTGVACNVGSMSYQGLRG